MYICMYIYIIHIHIHTTHTYRYMGVEINPHKAFCSPCPWLACIWLSEKHIGLRDKICEDLESKYVYLCVYVCVHGDMFVWSSRNLCILLW